MSFDKFNEKDISIIKWQLGCREVFIKGIIKRCQYEFPQIILLNPLKECKELNYEALSNLIWLTCPFLNDKIHRLESLGFIGKISDFIKSDITLSSKMRSAHADFYFLRNNIYMSFVNPSFNEERIDIFNKGIGGISDIRSLKCLHLHFSHYNIFKNNIAGLLTLHLIGMKVDCDTRLCNDANSTNIY